MIFSMESKIKSAKQTKTKIAKVSVNVTKNKIVVPSVVSSDKSSGKKFLGRLSGNKKKILLVSLWSLVFVVAFALVDMFVQYQNNDASVAVVNGERIYKDDFYTQIGEYVSLDAILNDIALGKAIMQEANKENIVVTETEVDDYINKFFVARFGTLDSLKEAITSSGDTYEGFRKNVKVQIIKNKKFPYTEADLKTFFDQNKESFKVNETDPEPVYEDVQLVVEYTYITNVISQDKGAAWIAEIQKNMVLQNNLSAKPTYEIFKQTRNLINGITNNTQAK